MEPSGSLKLVARERARRNPVSRPAYRQIHAVKAWSDAKLVAASDAAPASRDAGRASGPKRDRAVRALPIAIIAAVAVNFGAVVGLFGWGALQALGLVDEPAIETVQRSQAALISQLDASVQAVSGAVVGLSARLDAAEVRDEAANGRMTEFDAALGALRTSTNEIRAAQNAAEESWRKPLAELTAAAAKTRGEIVRLRASVDELGRARQPEVVAMSARIDRVEQAMLQHKLLGPIRGSIQEPGTPREPVASRESSPPADGHIINLTPDH